MKNKEDKNIENLVENLMAETSVENPSIEFTAKVMSGIFAVEKNKVFMYKPVISKRIWFIILGGIVALFTFLIFNTPLTFTGNNLNLTFLTFDRFLKSLSIFQISSMTANVILVATIMVFIQIFLLKNYLNKRFQK
jgi:hypothetical protein